MAWVYLITAGILEVMWAYAMKQSHSFTRFWPTTIMALTMLSSFGLLATPAAPSASGRRGRAADQTIRSVTRMMATLDGAHPALSLGVYPSRRHRTSISPPLSFLSGKKRAFVPCRA